MTLNIDIDKSLRDLDPKPEFLGGREWKADERNVLLKAVEDYSFYPDPAEAKTMFAFFDRDGEPINGLMYLNRGALAIKDRQNQGNTIPESVVRHTLQDKYDQISEYRSRAVDNIVYSDSIIRHLQDINPNAKVAFKDLYVADLLQERNSEATQNRAELFAVARFYDKYQFAQGDIPAMLQLSERPTITEVVEYIGEVLGTTHSMSLRKIAELMNVTSAKQLDYWTPIEASAAQHPYVLVDEPKPMNE